MEKNGRAKIRWVFKVLRSGVVPVVTGALGAVNPPPNMEDRLQQIPGTPSEISVQH